MTDRIEMKHPKQSGKANVLPEHVGAWVAKGWKEVPSPKIVTKSAKKKGQQND